MVSSLILWPLTCSITSRITSKSFSFLGYSSDRLVTGKSFEIAQQIICGENCTFVIHSNGAVSACGEGSNGRLGLGNSDDYDTLTLLSSLRGTIRVLSVQARGTIVMFNTWDLWNHRLKSPFIGHVNYLGVLLIVICYCSLVLFAQNKKLRTS